MDYEVADALLVGLVSLLSPSKKNVDVPKALSGKRPFSFYFFLMFYF